MKQNEIAAKQAPAGPDVARPEAAKEIRQPLSMPTEGAGGLTGEWRSYRPKINADKCSGCLLCWIYCPEAVISRDTRAVDYRYCKGCGLCAKECPAGAVEMIREGEGEHD